MDAIHQEETNSKLRIAAGEDDDSLSRMADVIASVPDRSPCSPKSQI